MGLLDGFKLIELTDKIEDCYLTITSRSLKFNRACARTLGLPDKIHLFINDRRLQIAITPADKDDEDGVDFTYDEQSRDYPILVKEPKVLKAVQDLTVLEKEGVNLSLTIKGVAYIDEKVIIFDFGEAVESEVKPRGKKKRIIAKDAEL